MPAPRATRFRRGLSTPAGTDRPFLPPGRTFLVPVLPLVLLVALVAISSCSSGGSSAGPLVRGASTSPSAGIRGTTLGAPIAMPDLRLTDTAGRPYDLRPHAAGRLTLLFFGYTHCPDICPTTMADLAAALTQVSPAVRRQTSVVFVTSDPARDTPPVIRHWLDMFDHTFVGLTGDVKTIDTAARSVGVPLEPPRRQADGSYTVDHGAQVLAFTPKGQARVVYLAGTPVADYAHDLPLLLRGDA
ncbi:SCO family protein [Frankia sp. B2]|nr:SCO family protein [Frankia sp. B2]